MALSIANLTNEQAATLRAALDGLGLTDSVGRNAITDLTARVKALEDGQVRPPAPTLSLSSAETKPEGNTGSAAFVWTLTLNRDGSNASFPYLWQVGAIGANPANVADFGGAFPSGSGTFAPGEYSKQISVPVTGDTAVEPAETFSLTVTGTGLNTVTSTGTISNDDAAAIPTLALAGPLTYNTNAAPGITVANIGSVPAGATPTISPNDGRLAVAGNATDGWRVVVGLTASSAGTIALTVAAAGANSATADVVVTAGASAPTLSTFSAAIDSARTAGKGIVPLLHWGDSTTHGFGAGTAGTQRAGAAAFSYPVRFAAALGTGALSDFRHSTDCIMGCGDESSANYPAYDPRVSFGTGVVNGGAATLGGNLFKVGGAGALGFTPAQNYDTVIILYATDAFTANGIGSVAIGAGAPLATFPTNEASAVKKLVLTNVHGTGAPGTGTINVTKTSSTQVFIVGIIAYNSTIKTIMHIKAGWGGSTAASNAATAAGYNPRACVTLIEPKMTVFNLGINDRRNAVSTATFKANMQTLITSAKATGDVGIMDPWASALAQATQAEHDAYSAVFAQLATENGAQLYDICAHYGPYTTWDPTLGYHDQLHPAAPGYEDEAAYLKGKVLAGL